MTISASLMKAILAMDSYNRGYNAGIIFGSDPVNSEAINGITQVGTATVILSANDTAARNIGFYAIAYEYNGEVVVSYRGTDEDILPWSNDPGGYEGFCRQTQSYCH